MKRAVWIAFGCVALLLLGLTLDRVADRGRFATAYSTYGSGPTGSRGLYLLVEELVSPVMRWAQDLARLPSRAVLVALGGCDAAPARPVSRYERQELVRWVRSGGVLIVAGAREYLPQALGVQFRFDPRCKTRWSALLDVAERTGEEGLPPADAGVPDAATAKPEEPVAGSGAPIERAADGGSSIQLGDAGAYYAEEDDTESWVDAPGETTWSVPMSPALRGLPVVPFRDPGELVVDPDLEPEILLGQPRRDEHGNQSDLVPLALTIEYGLGRVIVLASASMLQNAGLAESDGGELFVRLLRRYAAGAPVLFDEYHLGIGERRSLMRYLRQMGAAPLALQLVLLIAVLLWRAGARFGSVQTSSPAPPPAGATFVNALGQLYERASDARGALELIARDAYARIAAHHHVEVGAPAKLAQSLDERGASRAAKAVWAIDLAAKSGKDSAGLAAAVAQIDAALDDALGNSTAKG